MSTVKAMDLDNYVDRYIEFILENRIEKFFELDVDVIKGLSWVEKVRDRIESKTKKKCIPVWHKSRGIDYFKDMCKEYSYVAIGGIATREISKNEWGEIFPDLIKIAHKNKCKIHGLGLTSIEAIEKYNFDSVDSTTWISGARFGQLHLYKNGRIQIVKPKGKRAKDYKTIDAFNFEQWCKFQKYAERL